MGQMAAVTQVHPQDRVTGLEQREVGGQVCLGAGVRLNVGMVRREELDSPVAGQFLRLIPSAYLLVMTVPMASRTAREAKFSLAMSSSCEAWRAASLRIASKISGSVLRK